MILFLADPITGRYAGSVEDPVVIPPHSTYTPPPTGYEERVFLVDGVWTFDDPSTPEVEKLVMPITNIALDTTKEGQIWIVPTKQVVALTAKTLVPAGRFRAIVEQVVSGQVKQDLRFQAEIVEGQDGANVLTLPLYFETSGNFQITAERLNRGLDEIEAPFHVSFPKVDIDVIVNIPQ